METLIGVVVLITFLYWIGWKWIGGIVFLVGVLIYWYAKVEGKRGEEQRIADERDRQEKYAKRRAELLTKYLGDIETVDRIMNHQVWEGQTSEQLLDSLGKPVDVDEKVLKTKSKEVWKYNQTGKGRFALRVTLENNGVIGWEKKA